jgi:hypothetical protein
MVTYIAVSQLSNKSVRFKSVQEYLVNYWRRLMNIGEVAVGFGEVRLRTHNHNQMPTIYFVLSTINQGFFKRSLRTQSNRMSLEFNMQTEF